MPLDTDLAKITSKDKDNAREICRDLDVKINEENVYKVAEWLRKVRYEAVTADRKERGA